MAQDTFCSFKAFAKDFEKAFLFIERLLTSNQQVGKMLRYAPYISFQVVNDVVLTFESVDEILWCDHFNETSLPVLHMIPFAFRYFTKCKLLF